MLCADPAVKRTLRTGSGSCSSARLERGAASGRRPAFRRARDSGRGRRSGVSSAALEPSATINWSPDPYDFWFHNNSYANRGPSLARRLLRPRDLRRVVKNKPKRLICFSRWQKRTQARARGEGPSGLMQTAEVWILRQPQARPGQSEPVGQSPDSTHDACFATTEGQRRQAGAFTAVTLPGVRGTRSSSGRRREMKGGGSLQAWLRFSRA